MESNLYLSFLNLVLFSFISICFLNCHTLLESSLLNSFSVLHSPLNKCYILLITLIFTALGDEIINGKKAPEKLMLYMASLQNKHGQHVCGGFLISEDFVVSAAHCNRT